MPYQIADPDQPSFRTIILDDPSFPDLILNSLKLNHKYINVNLFTTISNIIHTYRWMKEQFMTANLVGRMFETVDFVSLPLSESKTLVNLTKFISNMCDPIGFDEEAKLEQYRLIRVSVFEPTKHFITYLFNNLDKLILEEEDKDELEDRMCWIHRHITHMELRSDEYDADIVSELVKWEVRAMVQMENEDHFKTVFMSIVSRTWNWKRDFPERQKRREVLLRGLTIVHQQYQL
ncbi:hypothetical protein BLNAU_3883 [Blattamonas nauphoetae]|uniref:Uncharacterized protein n=1 Tax=Blattamonas nauphoetae TaxID=2049346 RepID=A0ABQ9YBP5_9EUKA|nr:hypothetical protein BLNAU_3883 [Blattamonas nauphoetae]